MKTRKYFNSGGFEIVLDNVEGLGYFIEVEAKKDFGSDEKTRSECLKVVSSLGIDYKLSQEFGYPEMMLKRA